MAIGPASRRPAPSGALARSPRLPLPLAVPLRLLPAPLHSRLFALVLNRVLAEPVRQGELDFLDGRTVSIRVRDAGIGYCLTLAGGAFAACPPDRVADLSIEASAFDFMQLAGRQTDPDTLVFQRRLLMQGDTELGLAVKNLLDGLDAASLSGYGILEQLLRALLPLYRRLFTPT